MADSTGRVRRHRARQRRDAMVVAHTNMVSRERVESPEASADRASRALAYAQWRDRMFLEGECDQPAIEYDTFSTKEQSRWLLDLRYRPPLQDLGGSVTSAPAKGLSDGLQSS